MPTDYGTNNIIADGSATLYINNTQTSTLDSRVEDGAVGYLSELDYESISASIHDLQQEYMSIKDYYSAEYYSPTHILRKLIEDVEMCKRKCGINIEIDDEISDDNQALDQFLGEFMQQGGDINKGSL